MTCKGLELSRPAPCNATELFLQVCQLLAQDLRADLCGSLLPGHVRHQMVELAQMTPSIAKLRRARVTRRGSHKVRDHAIEFRDAAGLASGHPHNRPAEAAARLKELQSAGRRRPPPLGGRLLTRLNDGPSCAGDPLQQRRPSASSFRCRKRRAVHGHGARLHGLPLGAGATEEYEEEEEGEEAGSRDGGGGTEATLDAGPAMQQPRGQGSNGHQGGHAPAATSSTATAVSIYRKEWGCDSGEGSGVRSVDARVWLSRMAVVAAAP